MHTYESYDDPSGRFNFIATGGYVFETESRAKMFCEMWNVHWGAMSVLDTVSPLLSRQEYEEECQQLGIEAMHDIDCDSYGVRYGEFTPWLDGDKVAGYSPETCVKMSLAFRRLRGIEEERKAQPKPVRRPMSEKLCDCGHYSTHPMNTSRGIACPDCYDKMSD
jgi:hypothetical protein